MARPELVRLGEWERLLRRRTRQAILLAILSLTILAIEAWRRFG